MTTNSEQLLGLNDPLLHSLIDAVDEESRHAAMEQLLVGHAIPVIRRVLTRYRGSEVTVAGEDAEDITSTVTLRLVKRLQSTAQSAGAAIASFEDYVATQTFNAISDVLRRRSPERTRLRNRLRYVVERDDRLASWQTAAGLTAGLRAMAGRSAPADFALSAAPHAAVLYDRERTADAVVALFEGLRHPLLFDQLVRTMAAVWNVRDSSPADVDVNTPSNEPTQLTRVESRQYLEALWAEIRLLRPQQRAALLLNLRDVEGMNAVALFLFVGVATLDEIAEAIGIGAERLAELWGGLPLDDLTIGSMLGLSRQQVINLRKSARLRLARRMDKL